MLKKAMVLAGAAALLALANAQLDAAWKGSLRELADSRARLASAAERERRKLELNLHDGAQQRLVAATINLTLADEARDERERDQQRAKHLYSFKRTSFKRMATLAEPQGSASASSWIISAIASRCDHSV